MKNVKNFQGEFGKHNAKGAPKPDIGSRDKKHHPAAQINYAKPPIKGPAQ